MLFHLENAREYLSADSTFTPFLFRNILPAFAASFDVSVEHASAGEVLVTLMARMVQPGKDQRLPFLVLICVQLCYSVADLIHFDTAPDADPWIRFVESQI